jgi:uncharacterized membrane protein YdjX (TVP38/TMEM64 family)
MLLLGGLLLLFFTLPFKQWLDPVFARLDEAGLLGMLLFVLLAALFAILFVPVTVLIGAAGFLYGFPRGLLPSALVLMLGATAGFWGGRFFRSRLQKSAWFQHPVFRAVRRAMEENGYLLIALLRMTPFLHFMAGNLFFGTLQLHFVRYMLFSLLGMIPGTLLLVYGGSLARDGFSGAEPMSNWRALLFVLGLLIFAGIAWRITKRTRSLLQLDDGDRSTTKAR